MRTNFETRLIKVKMKKSKKEESKEIPLNVENEMLKTADIADSGSPDIKEDSKVDDAEIMSFFTLPAEYAFAAPRAISQMDGVGKSLDLDFDFISASAPYLVEIKGGERYLLDEVKKFITPTLKWQVHLQKQAGFNFKMKRKE